MYNYINTNAAVITSGSPALIRYAHMHAMNHSEIFLVCQNLVDVVQS